MPKITTIPAARLTAEHLEAWSHLQRVDRTVESPYFRPEFTQAVAAVRDSVEVAVLEEGGEAVGFFPFQRGRWGIGRAVGGAMSDYHGVVARQGLAWSAGELIRGCGLRAWDFDHVPAAQESFRSHHYHAAESPYLDLSEGFEAYQTQRRRGGSAAIPQTMRKARKLAREVGPLRFEYRTTDPRAFAALLEWKKAQYRRTKVLDVFSFGWPVVLLERILAATEEAFAGVLSALYVNDRVVAVHLGMRCHDVLHSWFPAFDLDFAKYSPGLILLLEIARSAAALGIRRFDLGRGKAEYKTSLRSSAVPLLEGSVAVSPMVRLLRNGWYRTRTWVRSSRLGAPARVAARWTRSLRGWLAFR